MDQARNQISLSMKLEAVTDHKSFRDQKEARQERPRSDAGPKQTFKPRDQQVTYGGTKGGNTGAKQEFKPSAGGNRPGQPVRQSSPFNNPFAALINKK